MVNSRRGEFSIAPIPIIRFSDAILSQNKVKIVGYDDIAVVIFSSYLHDLALVNANIRTVQSICKTIIRDCFP